MVVPLRTTLRNARTQNRAPRLVRRFDPETRAAIFACRGRRSRGMIRGGVQRLWWGLVCSCVISKNIMSTLTVTVIYVNIMVMQ